MNGNHNNDCAYSEHEAKIRRGEAQLNNGKRYGGSSAPKKSSSAFLYLVPLNILCLVLAALAVVGVASLARTAQATNPDTPITDGTVTEEVTIPVVVEPVTEPVTEPAHTDSVIVLPGVDVPSTQMPEMSPPRTEPPLEEPPEPNAFPYNLHPDYDLYSKLLGNSVYSEHAIIVDIEENRVVASRNSTAKMYPASMTKVMTLYVAVTNIPEADLYSKTFKITRELSDYLYRENATVAYFAVNEEVLLIDCLYGAILPSGADACIALATHIAGGEEAFAELMNQTVKKLGLTDTHFTNSTGLHDPNHYTTAYDMAVIMNAAMQNELCRQVLSTITYTSHSTPQNPNGITWFSTALSRLSPYNKSSLTFIAGKTGYTPEARQCLVSVSRTADGKEYIMVTGYATHKDEAVNDAVNSIKKHCVK
ncbi:MAG: D-alanyl-D-alanine carboxypeptidase [Clostridia bacterium]|nr:D-alanyl-D-alanine carboxypeptidase [Clostridia bacterium]